MSEPENFLARWSRRKQEAERPVETPEDAKPEDRAAGEPAASSDTTPAAEPIAKGEPQLDLSALPSIDSIDAATDVRAFLQKGVPVELTRAALRRAWAADPNIRDFIEVAENQWDFATGKDLSGFGPLDLSDDVRRRLVAEIFGDRRSDDPAHESPAEAKEQRPENSESPTSTPAELTQVAAPNETSTVVAPDLVHRSNNAAPQTEQSTGSEIKPTRRTHGRALPS
jgi:hypothetical protein